MSYVPKSSEQLDREGLLPEGAYDFEIIETSDRPSKKGNEMITLKLCVFDRDGNKHHIFDYIVFGNNFGERKLRHAADACDLMSFYDSGKLNDQDFQGATGKALVKIQDGTPDFPSPKNIIGGYVMREEGDAPPKRPTREIIEDDDLPF